MKGKIRKKQEPRFFLTALSFYFHQVEAYIDIFLLYSAVASNFEVILYFIHKERETK